MSPSHIEHDSRTTDEPSALPGIVLNGWMERLGIDREQVANAPLLLHRLQDRCLRCSRMEDCARALDEEFDDARWDSWHDYCSNSEILSTLGAIQNCGRAAAHLRLQIAD